MLVLILSSTSAAYQDSFAYLWEDETYPQLITSLKNNESEEKVVALYEKYISGISNLDRSRIEYHMVRYYIDNGNDEKAKAHLELAEAYFSLIDTGSEVMRGIAELDLISADYYITHSLSKGLENSDLTKELYRKYPEEVYVAITEAFRLLNTPGIAGGSSKKALALFEDIIENADLSPLDKYSTYAGLAMSSYERKYYEDSASYFIEAEKIYKSDNTMLEYQKKLEKKL